MSSFRIERTADRDLVVTYTVHAPRPRVFDAWSRADQFTRWWVPRSAPISLQSCEMDVRTGGRYTLVFTHPAAPDPVRFFGRYLEVEAPARIVWTNEEAGDTGQVTTVCFEDCGNDTTIVITDRYPTTEALDEAIASDGTGWHEESFQQLDAMLAADAE